MVPTRVHKVYYLLVAALSPVPLCGAVSESLRAVKHGDYVYVRTAFSTKRDLVLRIGKGSNRQINFANTRLVSTAAAMTEGELNGGELIHGNGDDATPWNINGTYIGGNHGCSPVHGLTQPKQRAKNASSAIMLYTSSKSYPVAINSKMGPIICSA